jgi:predicted ATPase
VRVTKIKLQNLQEEMINVMLSQMLRGQDNEISPLARVIHQQTEGNLFFILELLRSLQNDDLLLFNCTEKSWSWNEQDIRFTFQQTTVGELVTDRIFQLPKDAQDLLKVAACLGTKLNVKILGHVLGITVERYLEMAADAGLLLLKDPAGYEFAHDGIREATYNLIPADDRACFHLDVGRALKRLELEEWESYIFVVLGQLEKGGSLIQGWQERSEVAALCLRGGTIAVRSSSFKTASRYFLFGVKLLDDRSWRDEYNMCMELYSCATEIAYCNGHFESLDSLVECAIRKSRTFRDTLRVRTCQVYSLGGRNLSSEAVVKGLFVLQELGETFPKKANRLDWFTAFRKTWRSFRRKSPESILRLPFMCNQDKLAAMQMMNLLFSFSFTNLPFLAPLITCRMVDLTLEYGLCAISSPAMVMFAALLIRWGQRIDEGCRCGRLAFAIYDKFGEKAWWGRLCAGYYSCVSAWTNQVRDDLAGMKNAHRLALETGDIEVRLLQLCIKLWTKF